MNLSTNETLTYLLQHQRPYHDTIVKVISAMTLMNALYLNNDSLIAN